MLFPMLIGWSLAETNKGITNPLEYNYTVPMLIFASLGVLALVLAIWLKGEDKKRVTDWNCRILKAKR